jgi:hypothetical protein
MRKERRKFSAAFKTKVALEAIKEEGSALTIVIKI